MLILQALDTAGAPLADYLVAIDTVGAGAGERVLVLDEGTGARQIVGSKDAPVRSVIVGIVDETVSARQESGAQSTRMSRSRAYYAPTSCTVERIFGGP